MFFKAAFKIRNVLILAAGAFLAAGTSAYAPEISWMPLVVGAAGVALYTTGVIRTLQSREFRRELELSEKLEEIGRLSRECNDMYRRISGRLGKNLRSRVIRVLRQRDELLCYFDRYSDDPVKQRVIEQALKLVKAYISLVGNCTDRIRELSPRHMNELVTRINKNNRRLGLLKNYQAVLELTKTIEMDEKLLQRLREERSQLEIVGVKLEQIESSIAGFKHRILSNEMSDPVTQEIENSINEASALDNALNEQRRFRQGIR
ncbi:MAG: hypothetical protein GX279_02575 [Clostridiaceae bacterium]|nr:hypothetical protein [Clostridiaceae bacterium]